MQNKNHLRNHHHCFIILSVKSQTCLCLYHHRIHRKVQIFLPSDPWQCCCTMYVLVSYFDCVQMQTLTAVSLCARPLLPPPFRMGWLTVNESPPKRQTQQRQTDQQWHSTHLRAPFALLNFHPRLFRTLARFTTTVFATAMQGLRSGSVF